MTVRFQMDLSPIGSFPFISLHVCFIIPNICFKPIVISRSSSCFDRASRQCRIA